MVQARLQAFKRLRKLAQIFQESRPCMLLHFAVQAPYALAIIKCIQIFSNLPSAL